jgi:hypothetical protein
MALSAFHARPSPQPKEKLLQFNIFLTLPWHTLAFTLYTNPKRKRGNQLPSSLMLRVSVNCAREQYNDYSKPMVAPRIKRSGAAIHAQGELSIGAAEAERRSLGSDARSNRQTCFQRESGAK